MILFRRAIGFLILMGWASAFQVSPPAVAGMAQWQRRPVRESEISATIQAIEDEIYDLNLESEYLDLQGSKGPRDSVTVNAYFQPDVLDDSRSWVIYKLMPGGEVVRMYEIGRTGRIYLYLKPGEFRITQPSYPTVYMDDDELCKMKHDWIRRKFVVNLQPSKELIEAARARQLDRRRHTNGPSGKPPEANQR